MDLSMPNTVSDAAPGQLYRPRQFVFDHWPSLGELLPKWQGIPGYTYFQCCVTNLRRAQDEGWVEVDNTVIYTIEGPKGSVDLKLLCRGRRIPGQPHNSGARLCFADKTGEALTGLWINPHQHEEDQSEEILEEKPQVSATQTSVNQEGASGAP
jgi:hypothetical protein